MNVWYLSAYDQPLGQSTRTHDFAKELVKRGHSVTFFTNSYCHFMHIERLSSDAIDNVEYIDDVRVIWLKVVPYKGNGLWRGLNMVDNFVKVLTSSKKENPRPDIIICPSVPILTGWAGYLLAKRLKVPFVFEVRDVWPIALVDIGGLTKFNPIYWAFRYMEINIYQKAAAIFSTLPFIQKHVKESGADPDKIVFIPNGVTEDAESDLIPYDGGDNDHLVVMYVGGFGLDHDVVSIVEAATLLQTSDDKRFKFVLIGDGDKKFLCQKIAESNKLQNIEFRPPVPKKDINFVQREADILVAAITDSPSYRFGLNLNKICSYLISNRPVLFAGNSPNNPVYTSNGGICIQAESPDKMANALKLMASIGPEERIKMAENGFNYAQTELSMEKLGQLMDSSLSEIVVNRMSTS